MSAQLVGLILFWTIVIASVVSVYLQVRLQQRKRSTDEVLYKIFKLCTEIKASLEHRD